jgi:hypothetical protein
MPPRREEDGIRRARERLGGFLDRTLEVRPVGHSRAGRHEPETFQIDVPRQAFDAEHRAIAHHLDQTEPWWVIWWGVGTRQFFALPTWDAPCGLAVSARTPGELLEEMRAAENGQWVAVR